ncbi:MAG: response regulator [Candidatus Dormibacteraeota bacterium]|nr:response regulator [Candidatus Dormibacteraeota bacterium]
MTGTFSEGSQWQPADTVVVADDDPVLRAVLTYTLHQGGYEVFEAEDGFEALRAIRRLTVSVLVTDVVMPRMDGVALTLAARLLPRTAQLPIVVMTGLPPNDGRIVRLRGIERLEVIFKPFSFDDVRRRVDRLAPSASIPPPVAPYVD